MNLMFIMLVTAWTCFKPGFHLIVPIAPIVPKQDQAIETIIWKHYGDDRDEPDDRDDHDRLDSFKFYPDRDTVASDSTETPRMKGTIEATQIYPNMHRLFLESILFLTAWRQWRQQTQDWRSRRSSCTSVCWAPTSSFLINLPNLKSVLSPPSSLF